MENEELNEEQKKQVAAEFESFKNKEYSEDDVHRVLENENEIMKKANSKQLRGFINDIKLFFRMLKDFFSGNYKSVPVGTIVAIAGTLIYVLVPADIVPDVIPGLGLIDDATVLGLCIKLVKTDIDNYVNFLDNK